MSHGLLKIILGLVVHFEEFGTVFHHFGQCYQLVEFEIGASRKVIVLISKAKAIDEFAFCRSGVRAYRVLAKLPGVHTPNVNIHCGTLVSSAVMEGFNKDAKIAIKLVKGEYDSVGRPL
jgi:hypothetical protein